VIVEEGVNNISNYAFYGCDIITISIPSSVTFINGIPNSIVNVAADNPNFSSIDGVLFNKTQTVLLKYPSNKQDTSYTIPANVIEISDYYTFFDNKHLNSVTIPHSVTAIGSSNFWYCTGLKEIINHQITPQKLYSAFYGVNLDECTLFVPAASIEAYQVEEGWSRFANIKVIQ